MTVKISKLVETLNKRGKLMDRAVAHMERTKKKRALYIVMGWMSIEQLNDMVEFWDESTND